MALIWMTFLILTIGYGAISSFSFYSENSGVFEAVFILIMTVVLTISVFIKGKDKTERIMVLGSYILMLIFLFYDREISPIDSTDPEGFHRSSLMKSRGNYSYDYGGVYTDIIGLLYKVIGTQRIIAQYINVLLVITIIYIGISILNELNIVGRYRNIGILLLAFNPHFLILSVVLRREQFISLMVTISFYFFVKYWKEGRSVFFILAIAFCLFGAAFHSGIISLVAGYTVFYIAFDRETATFNYNKSVIAKISICLLLFVVAYVYFGDQLLLKFNSAGSFDELNERLYHQSGASGYTVGFNISNDLLNFFVNTPLRTIYFIMSPMPWTWRGLGDIVAFCMSSVFYTIGYVITITSIRHSKSHNKCLLIGTIFSLLIMIVMFSWGVRNAGTAMRHRDKTAVPYVIMTVLAIYERKKYEDIIMRNDTL